MSHSDDRFSHSNNEPDHLGLPQLGLKLLMKTDDRFFVVAKGQMRISGRCNGFLYISRGSTIFFLTGLIDKINVPQRLFMTDFSPVFGRVLDVIGEHLRARG